MKIIQISNKNHKCEYRFSDEIALTPLNFDLASTTSDEKELHDFLLKNHDFLKENDGVLIDKNCTWQQATIIILHLRLTQEWALDSKMIIWHYNENYSDIVDLWHHYKFNKNLVFGDKTIHLNEDELPEEITIENIISESFNSSNLCREEFDISKFSVKSLEGNHKIANEWGAFKLAHTAGLTSILHKIEEQQPASKTLYFKYLKCKENIVVNTEGEAINTNACTIKYLYIDDNYNKGWELVFNAIFQQINSNLGIESFTEIPQNDNDVENSITQIIEKIKHNEYQGVLLDLRLIPSDDTPEMVNTKITEFTGGKILKKLKEEFPFLPIVMVNGS
jgi:hypothetical protein